MDKTSFKLRSGGFGNYQLKLLFLKLQMDVHAPSNKGKENVIYLTKPPFFNCFRFQFWYSCAHCRRVRWWTGVSMEHLQLHSPIPSNLWYILCSYTFLPEHVMTNKRYQWTSHHKTNRKMKFHSCQRSCGVHLVTQSGPTQFEAVCFNIMSGWCNALFSWDSQRLCS